MELIAEINPASFLMVKDSQFAPQLEAFIKSKDHQYRFEKDFKQVSFLGDTKIGRWSRRDDPTKAPTDLLMLGDRGVSLVHCELVHHLMGGWAVRDESSRYGTFIMRRAETIAVKEQPGHEASIERGDVLILGELGGMHVQMKIV